MKDSVLSCLCLLTLVFAWYYNQNSSSSSSSSSASSIKPVVVERQVWPPLHPLETQLTPIVFTNTPANHWPAFQKWNLDYFSRHSHLMPDWEITYQTKSSRFVYSSDERPLLNEPMFKASPVESLNPKRNVTAETYINLLKKRERQLLKRRETGMSEKETEQEVIEHVYWTDGIGVLGSLSHTDLPDISFLGITLITLISSIIMMSSITLLRSCVVCLHVCRSRSRCQSM